MTRAEMIAAAKLEYAAIPKSRRDLLDARFEAAKESARFHSTYIRPATHLEAE